VTETNALSQRAIASGLAIACLEGTMVGGSCLGCFGASGQGGGGLISRFACSRL